MLDTNATQAAIRAGYSARNADKIGPELLGKTRVKREIAAAMAERSQRTQVTQDRLVLESSYIAFADPLRAFDDDGTLKDVKDWPDDIAAPVSSLEIHERIEDDGVRIIIKKIRFWDKGRQLELLGRHLGMFTENVDMRINHVQALEELQNAADRARTEARRAVVDPFLPQSG